MVNAAAGEQLRDLFVSDRWQQHLQVLSEAVVFSLGVFSAAGALLAAADPHYPCSLLRATPLRDQCRSCGVRGAARALKRGRPVLYKCPLRVVCFALPVEYLSERAMVIGRGSFASYRDLRTFLNLAGDESAAGALPAGSTLRFTTPRDARRACGIVRSSLQQLLKNEQENAALRLRMDALDDLMGQWDASAAKDPVTVYDRLMTGLLHLLAVQSVVLFFRDPHQNGYAPLYGRDRGGAAPPPAVLDGQDPVVRLLQAKKPYVATSEPVLGLRREHLRSGSASWFFPLWTGGGLEGIVGLGHGALRESDIRIVRALCTKTALTVENLRLHADLSRKFERFAATVELAKALAPIRSYEVLLESILSKSADLLAAERGSLMLLDRETDALLLEVRKGVIEGLAEKLRIPKGEGIAGQVATRGEPLLVQDLELDPRVLQKNRGHYKTRSFLSVPLKIGDRTIGVLNLSDKVSGEVFTEDDLQLIQSFASHAVVVLERNVLYGQTEELKRLSITDPLTGLLNRRYFQERLEEEIARSRRHGRSLSLMMLDIDGFKTYNDTFGHPSGDRLLKLVSEAIMRTVRSMDIVARYGGDEFLVLLPETEPARAAQIAERIRGDVADVALEPGSTPARGIVAVTVSIGIAGYPRNGATLEEIISQVDRALYQAKSRGKNRTEQLP